MLAYSMQPIRVVLDTNVLVAALRSKQGLSYALLQNMQQLGLELCLSVALVLEYESVLKRPGLVTLTPTQIDSLLDFLCGHSAHPPMRYLWRPFLPDPADDLVLELAFNARALVVTHNHSDFVGSQRLGVLVVTPRELFTMLRQKE